MKRIIIYLPVFLLFLSSCEDVLDKKPLDIISDAVVWSDPVLVDAYLNECMPKWDFSMKCLTEPARIGLM